jgi:hypothetical protein
MGEREQLGGERTSNERTNIDGTTRTVRGQTPKQTWTTLGDDEMAATMKGNCGETNNPTAATVIQMRTATGRRT